LKYTPKVPKNIRNNRDDIKTPHTFFDIMFSSLWRQKSIVNDLIQDKIDIYHGLSGEIPMGLRQTPIRSVVTIHDLIFLTHPELYQPVDRIVYNKKFKYAVHH